MSLTQHEVVKKVGISRGTLHRILAGSPLVKATTRERVLRELERLDYVPNAIAQGLKTRRTRSLGVIGPAAANISNAGKLSALYTAARERGYAIIFAYSDGSVEGDATSIRELRSRMVDGIIAFGRGLSVTASIYKKIRNEKVPFVSLYPTPGVETDCIYVDTRKAFRRLTEHLIDLGHTDIGLLTNASPSGFIKNRELGFRDAMAKAQLPVREEWIAYGAPEDVTESGEEKKKPIWEISNYQAGFSGASRILARVEAGGGPLIQATSAFATEASKRTGKMPGRPRH